jgi:hypothetical protein
MVPTGRATSASADTDIVVVPALVLSGGTRRGAFATKRQVSKASGRIFAGNLEKSFLLLQK